MKIVGLVSKKNKYDFEEFEGISFHALFDNLDDGVCIINRFGIVEYVNKAYKQYFSFTREIKKGCSIYESEIDTVILKCYTDKKFERGVIYCNSKESIEVTAWPIYNKNEFNGIISVYRKIDTQKFCSNVGKPLIKTHSFLSETKNELVEPFQTIIGTSKKMKEALLIAQKAAKTSSTVLIRGESGTGKELVAKAIHEASNRSEKPFIAVNCGAIPSTLIESELFGHEQGAFTGAIKQKIGKFEQADGGTVFLDEIGELPLEMQVKLLRIIQEREFERVGGIYTIKVNVRIIAATNRNLEEMVRRGVFREDLYYRINVIPIYLPLLKERREDIPLLIDHFIRKISTKLGKFPIQLSKDAKECLVSYDWPGNVRELENVIERIVALNEKETVNISDLPINIVETYSLKKLDRENSNLINLKKDGDIATFEEYEREIIRIAIEKFGSFNAAGKALGITHKTVAHKARKYNII